MDLFHVKLPEKTIYAKIITARTAVFDLRGVKGQGQKKLGWKLTFFIVKMPEKTICAKIITARAAVSDLRGVKGQVQNKFRAENGLFLCKIARENDLR